MKKIVSILAVLLILSGIFAFSGCTEKDNNNGETTTAPTAESDGESAFVSDKDNPVVTMKIKDYGTITIELYYSVAPNTVKNFISLANKGFYDGLIFHRVIENFMIQGGDPLGIGTGNPGYSIKGEFRSNGVKNDLRHTRGVISMARGSKDRDSAGSQFFICQRDYTSGDGDYAAFGMVIDGIEIVDKIAAVETDSNDKPLTDVIIESVTVDTHGIAYDEPETINR